MIRIECEILIKKGTLFNLTISFKVSYGYKYGFFAVFLCGSDRLVC